MKLSFLTMLTLGLLVILAPSTRPCEPNAEQQPVVVKPQPNQDIRLVNWNSAIPVVVLGEEPADPLKAEPKYASKKRLYGSIQLGAGPNNRIALVVDEAEGQPPRIYIDRNNDKDLTNDGLLEWRRQSDSTLDLFNVAIDVPDSSGKSIPYTFNFLRSTYRHGGLSVLFCHSQNYPVPEPLRESPDGRITVQGGRLYDKVTYLSGK